ncbi:MAG: lipid-A-disaccharide synthase [Ignavibacteriales bacterium]|nr:lipid-A-disaccharide synthase [Ignavibacteriales bacterium]
MVKKVMIIAGEASGDLHGSGVVRELKHLSPNIEIFGVGGENMKREGMELTYHINELNFMGFVEVLKHLPVIKSVQRTLEELLKLRKPEVVVFIDYPGFNLRFAPIAKRFGVKVVYYISPQVWAWHKSRVKKMRGIVDTMLVIFPFEVDVYRQEHVDAEFVGHPLLEGLKTGLDRQGFCKRYGLNPNKKILALLPGSRPQEIENIFPVMLGAARIIARHEDMEIVVGVAPTLEESYFKTFYNVDGVHLVKGASYEVMDSANFAIVTSGTATLETALFETPMMVVYKTSWLTYLIGRMLIQVKNIGLVNIVAGKQIVPEFIQHRATASNLANEVMRILHDESLVATMKLELAKVRERLGEIGASRRVAERILQMA